MNFSHVCLAMGASVLDKAKACVSGLNCVVSKNLSSEECLEFFSSWLVVQCEVLLMKGCLVKHGCPGCLLQHVDIIQGLSTTVRHIIQASPSRLDPVYRLSECGLLLESLM